MVALLFVSGDKWQLHAALAIPRQVTAKTSSAQKLPMASRGRCSVTVRRTHATRVARAATSIMMIFPVTMKVTNRCLGLVPRCSRRGSRNSKTIAAIPNLLTAMRRVTGMQAIPSRLLKLIIIMTMMMKSKAGTLVDPCTLAC